jgi:hypothetical protein
MNGDGRAVTGISTRLTEATMGYSISWLMVNGKDRQGLLDELGLEATGELG